MNCQPSSGRTIQENKVGPPWKTLAIKQPSAPSRSEMVRKLSKTAMRQKTMSAMARPIQLSLTDLYQDKAQQVTIDLPIAEDLHLNGKAHLHLRLQSSTDKGLLSVQLMELGSKKYLQPYPAVPIRPHP